MRLKEYFMGIPKSLYPDKHREMVKMPFFNLVKYFIFVVVLSLLLSIIIMLPMISTYKDHLTDQVEQFDTFQIDADVEAEEPIMIFEKPKVVVDLNKEEMTNEWILINREAINYKKYFFFGKEKAVFSDYKSVKEEGSISLYKRVMIFLLPSIIFWIVVLYLIKYFILMLILSTLGYVFFISGKNNVTWQQSVKVAIFTATPMVLIDLILWPIIVMYYIPIALYVIYFIVGLIMVSSRKYKHKHSDFTPKKKKRNEGDFLMEQHED